MPSLSDNTSYLVTVMKGASSSPGAEPGANKVTANAMAKLNIEIQNHWVNIMEALGISTESGGGLIKGIIDGAQIFTGTNFLPNIFTSHVWRGSNGLEISLQMRFDAWDDAGQDVLLPLQKLIAMFMPTRAGSGGGSGILGALGITESLFLHPPGPTPYEYLHGDTSNMFTVQLGNFMRIDNLIPTSIRWECEERYVGESGQDPIAAMVTLGFISYTIPTGPDVLKYFMHQLVTSGIGGNLLRDQVNGIANTVGQGSVNDSGFAIGGF
jgi:hypothetical protein